MVVVFTSPHSDPEANLGEPDSGGQCVYEHQLAQELAKQNINVLTFCRQTGKRPNISKVSKNYSIYRIITKEPIFIPKEIIESELVEFTKKTMQILNKKIKNEKVVLHGHYWDGGKLALMLKYNYLNWPLVWTPHSLGSIKRNKYYGFKNEIIYNFLPRLTWENYTAYASDRIVISSQDEKQKLLSNYSIVRDFASVVPPGLDLKQFAKNNSSKLRKELGIPKKNLILLCIGRMVRNKGFHHAIQILKKLKESSNKNFTLIIVGGSNSKVSLEEISYKRQLELLVNDFALKDSVIFHHAVPHEEVVDFFSLADVFLMTSENEPFGLTTIEAMASKTTVVGHYLGGTSNIIIDNETGFLVDIHEYETAANKISKILEKKEMRTKIEEQALNHVNGNYSWEKKALDFLEIYKQVLENEQNNLSLLTNNNYFLQKNLKV